MANLTRTGTHPSTGASDPGRDVRPNHEFLHTPVTMAVDVQAGQLVAFDTNGKGILSNATNANTLVLAGIATEKKKAGQRVACVWVGHISGYRGATPRDIIYASDTPGEISNTAGTVSKIIGACVANEPVTGDNIIRIHFAQ